MMKINTMQTKGIYKIAQNFIERIFIKDESQESGKPKVSLKKEPIESYKERQKQLKKIN